MRRMGTVGKIAVLLIGLLVTLFVVAVMAAHLFEDRLRAYLEQEANSRTSDYQVRIGRLTLSPMWLAAQATDVTIAPKRHPELRLLQVEGVRATLHWSGLLRGKVMADLRLEAPTVHVIRSKLDEIQEDLREKKPTEEEQQAWQDQVLDLMPVALTLAIEDGKVTYEENKKPVLKLTGLQMDVGPIRNVTSEQGVYPSPVQLKARVQNGGTLHLDGKVDAFAKPHVAGLVDVGVQNLDLTPFAPVADRYHVKLHQGRVALDAHVQYAPWIKQYDVRDLTVDKLITNYVYRPTEPKPEKKTAKKAAEKTAEAAKQPETVIRIERATITDSEFGVVHAGVDPPYRVFLTKTSAKLKDFSNRLKEKAAQVTASGQFMASGPLEVRGVFRPDTEAPDFDLSVQVEQTQVKMLNDLLRAHGALDVAGGTLSVYSQFKVEHGRIEGYVKPVIRELDVYDPDQERGKGAMQKLYEGVVGGATELLTNPKTGAAGTQVQVTGTFKNTKIDAWQAAIKLVQNAFFQLIVPRFERPALPGKSAVLNIE